MFCAHCMKSLKEDDTLCPRCGGSRRDLKVNPHHLKPGTVLQGKYLVGGVLGEGGFGITYIGLDLVLEIRIAIKEYYPSGVVNRNHNNSDRVVPGIGGNEEVFDRGKKSFMEEARILARFVDEPGIVGVRDLFPVNNTAYIIMDYLEGVTLKRYLDQEGPIRLDRLLELLLPVMRSLERVHGQGLIHRDISPDNIMMLKNGALKLLDFGAARDISAADEKSRSVMLKRGYAPEEQYRSKGRQGPWTDVYALSATIYKCLTGITPEDGVERVFEDRLRRPSELGVAISEAQEKALLHGMAILPESRCQSVRELCRGLCGNQLEERLPEGGAAPKMTVPQSATAEEDQNMDEEDKNKTVFADSATASADFTTAAPRKDSGVAAATAFPDKERYKAEMRRRKRRTVAIGITAVVLLVVVVSIVFTAAGSVSIAGRTYSRSDTQVYIKPTEAAPLNKGELAKLKSLPNLTWLRLTDCDLDNDDLSVLGELTWLKTLVIDSGPGITDIAPLGNLTELTYLKLSGTSVADLSPLRNCRSLYRLDVSNSSIENISALAELPGLNELNCSYTKVRDLAPLAELRRLSILYADGNQLTTIAPLENLTRLYILSLNDNQIASLSPLKGHTKLRYFYCGANRLDSLEGLDNCTLLETVDLSGNLLSDLSLLKKSSEDLKELYLQNNRIADVAPLADCGLLKTLNITNNKIETVDPLNGCAALKILWMDNNLVERLDLSACTGLQYFSAANNRITVLEPLNMLTTYSIILDLSNNLITDLGSLPRESSYNALSLYGNPATDFSAVEGLKGDVLLITYPGEEGMIPVEKSDFKFYYLLDVPLDRQEKLRKQFGYIGVSFATAAEADEYIQSRKDKVL